MRGIWMNKLELKFYFETIFKYFSILTQVL
jgi:hypothetical protein